MNVLFKSDTGVSELVSVNTDERLLMAGLRSSLKLPYECATGTCGSCAASVLTGEAENLWPGAPGMKALRRNAEGILLCQYKAKSDCTVLFKERLSSHSFQPALPDHGSSRLIGIKRIGEGLFSVSLACTPSFNPEPGQFMLIGAEGIPGFRAYSMSSVEDDGRLLTFVVRSNFDGKLATRLCDINSIGHEFKMFGPLGSAYLRPDDIGDISVIAGGSGLGVAISITERLMTRAFPGAGCVRIFIGLRTSDCVPVLDWLSAVHDRFPDEKFSSTVSFSEDNATSDLYPAIKFRNGQVHQAALDTLDVWKSNTTAFVAGPPPMVDLAVRSLIKSKKFGLDNIRYDRFS